MSHDDAEIYELNAGGGAPGISVLMPVFEQRTFVADAIRSILNQKAVTLEFIISDDASGDDSYATIRDCIERARQQGPIRHRIVLRKGKSRLWRNHLPRLAEMASCDLLCQAHGDDISHPDRLHYVVAGFERYPGCTMVASGYTNILGNNADAGTTVSGMSFPLNDQTIIDSHPNLIGATMAWRRSALRCFPRLDTAFAAASHDRILAFRAYLAGSILLLDMPLVKRRVHPLRATFLSFDEPDPAGRFGWNLSNLAHLQAMLSDLETARSNGIITPERQRVLSGIIRDTTSTAMAELVGAYKRHTNAGLHVAWVDRATLIKMKLG